MASGIQEGPRGGKFRISESGKKVYVDELSATAAKSEREDQNQLKRLKDAKKKPLSQQRDELREKLFGAEKHKLSADDRAKAEKELADVNTRIRSGEKDAPEAPAPDPERATRSEAPQANETGGGDDDRQKYIEAAKMAAGQEVDDDDSVDPASYQKTWKDRTDSAVAEAQKDLDAFDKHRESLTNPFEDDIASIESEAEEFREQYADIDSRLSAVKEKMASATQDSTQPEMTEREKLAASLGLGKSYGGDGSIDSDWEDALGSELSAEDEGFEDDPQQAQNAIKEKAEKLQQIYEEARDVLTERDQLNKKFRPLDDKMSNVFGDLTDTDDEDFVSGDIDDEKIRGAKVMRKMAEERLNRAIGDLGIENQESFDLKAINRSIKGLAKYTGRKPGKDVPEDDGDA